MFSGPAEFDQLLAAQPFFPLVNSDTKLFCHIVCLLPRPPLKRPIQSYAYNQFVYSGTRGFDVIKTACLASLCLIGLGAMVYVNAARPTPIPKVGASADQTPIATDPSHDTLTKADKLEIAYVLVPVAAEPVMLATQVSDETSPQPVSLTISKIVSRHWHDHNGKKFAAESPDRRIKIQEAKNGKSVDRPKATADPKPCRRPEGFVGLLRALNLSPGCDT
jgi:hypothetical protein